MSVALLFVSHQHIASHLLDLSGALHAEAMQNYAVIEVPLDSPVDEKLATAREKLDALQMSDGLIIITDMFGSTPSNIAQLLAKQYRAPLLSGLNLPMLMRIHNYRDTPLPILLDKAISGGQQGVMLHTSEDE
jgi:PTS system ascorbate-specific IIA component